MYFVLLRNVILLYFSKIIAVFFKNHMQFNFQKDFTLFQLNLILEELYLKNNGKSTFFKRMLAKFIVGWMNDSGSVLPEAVVWTIHL